MKARPRKDCPTSSVAREPRSWTSLAERGATYGADWLLYLDADERIECDLRTLLESTPTRISGIKLGLLDAYLSDGQVQPYTGGALADLSRLFGPDERRILMLWRPERAFCFLGSDQREPVPGLGCRIVEGPTVVKHFGKAISISQWEETCAYYTEHFPEPYRSKWAERRGRAIHSESDFGRPLLPWKDAIADTIRIDPPRRNGRLLLRRLQASVIHGVRRRTPRREKVEQRGEIAHL